MTDSTDMEKMSGAEALRIRAAEWLMQQRTSDNWGAEDQQALDEWLAESPAHLLAYWRLDAAWSRTNRLAALRGFIHEPAVRAERKRMFPFFLGSAAITTSAAILGFALFNRPIESAGQPYTTSVGGRETIRLADGSQIELNTDTAVRILDRTDRRRIWLDKGEAYFQVAHDSKHPFEVMVGNHKITDIGTKFLVRQGPTAVSVAVVEGRVTFGTTQHSTESREIPLASGDTLIATANATTVTKKPSSELTNDLEWRHGLLVFYRKPLAEAAEEFNRYNREKIVVADRASGEMSVTGTLSATDPDQFIRMARNLFGLRVERRNGEILISR